MKKLCNLSLHVELYSYMYLMDHLMVHYLSKGDNVDVVKY
jgi:hypothetical protein